ncbi:MAG: CNNM domain-containing protein [Verrucomicrobia bacterium]|nr:CNNM domain-containing protein [Verrucomicrobiota bacterium]
MIFWLAIAGLLLVSFVFSGIEAGILSLNRVRLRNRVKHRDPAAMRLQKLLKEPERLLLTVVIVTNLANLFAITLATAELVRHWGHAGYLIALLVFLPLYLFGLELFPKSLFRRFPMRALASLAAPLRLAYLALGPVMRIAAGLGRWLFPPVPDESRKLFAAREDFKYVTLETERAGAITPTERRLIHGIVDFRSVCARDLMQPLPDFPTIHEGATIEELIEASRDGSLERFLVVSAGGEILGMVSLFEAILARAPGAKISSHMRRIASVPATESVLKVLRKLRTARTRVALVVDGETPKGLLFAEDLYRRLVSG